MTTSVSYNNAIESDKERMGSARAGAIHHAEEGAFDSRKRFLIWFLIMFGRNGSLPRITWIVLSAILFFFMVLVLPHGDAMPDQEPSVSRGEEADGNGTPEKSIISSIQKRNRTIEDDPRWLNRASKRLLIRNLKKMSASEYPFFARYLDDGRVYIIVHPAFYVFFHDYRDSGGPIFNENIVEQFLNEPATDPSRKVLQLREKKVRDFLEYASTARKLVILILPGKYREYEGFLFQGRADEYARYLNEVTNESESVLYLYSKQPNTGRLSDRSMVVLKDFLAGINAREVLLGGGYFERCLEGFHKKLLRYTNIDVYLVPELIQLSPNDIGFFLSRRLLHGDSLDNEAFTGYIRKKIDQNEYQGIDGIRNISNEFPAL